MKSRVVLLTACLSIPLTGCLSEDNPNRRATIGATVGAVVGAIAGNQSSSSSGKWIGALVGALAGGAVGHYMDNQQREFEQALAAERDAHQLEIARLQDETLRLTVDSGVSFDVGQSTIKPTFQPSLRKVADVMNRYDQTVIHVVGHTDSSGPDDFNRQLSNERAIGVKQYLIASGVPYSRIRYEGRGEIEPRASNATAAGRQQNRRVEMFVKPIVEGNEAYAYESPRYASLAADR